MRALSIRQPWTWLIVAGHKPVESRDWRTDYRGPILLHAGKTMTLAYWDEVATWAQREMGIVVPEPDALPRGGIVGRATVTDCVSEHPSPFFSGPHALVLKDAEALPFVPWRGMLGFFHVPNVRAKRETPHDQA